MKCRVLRKLAGVAAITTLASTALAPVPAFAEWWNYFDLSSSHWVVSSGVFDWTEERGIIHGTARKWRPDAQITRAEAAGILWNYHGNPAPKSNPNFPDASTLSWASDAVAWCAEQGIFSGDSSTGVFNPWTPLTREQSAKILFIVSKDHPSSLSSFQGFQDPESVSSWAQGVMSWAVQNGIITGRQTANGAYLDAKEGCTRAEFAAMLYRVEDKYGEPEKPGDSGSTDLDQLRLFTITLAGDTHLKPGQKGYFTYDAYIEEEGSNMQVSLQLAPGLIEDGFASGCSVSMAPIGNLELTHHSDTSFGFLVDKVHPGNIVSARYVVTVPANAVSGQTYTTYATISADGIDTVTIPYTLTVA